MNAKSPKPIPDRTSSDRSNWNALFLKRADQAAFSVLWIAVVASCVWYFATARGVQPIDIDEAPPQTISFLVEINSGSKQEFECLPGIGPKISSAIIQWREENGPFESVESMVEVPGLSPTRLEKLRPFLYFESPEKVTQR